MASIPSNNQSGSQNGRKKKSIYMDMTPMVDLAFLLLTFFILTTHLNNSTVMEMSMPDNPEHPQQQPPLPAKRVLNLVLGKDNAIYWYKGLDDPEMQKIEFSDVRDLLFEKKKEIKDMVVLIKPLKSSQYKNLVDILDEIGITGVKNFYIMKVSDTDQNLFM